MTDMLSGTPGTEISVRCTRYLPSRIHSKTLRAAAPSVGTSPGKRAVMVHCPTKMSSSLPLIDPTLPETGRSRAMHSAQRGDDHGRAEEGDPGGERDQR